MTEPKQLISELLRPQQLSDLTLPQKVVDRLQRMIDERSPMNMVFYGKPGSGKTTAARIFINALGRDDSIEINGSTATGVDYVRDHIERFASSFSMFGGNKICFIDEAEFVSKNAQAALRQVIEKTSCNCRYLFAVNEISKLLPAIRSRLMEICFDITPSDRADMQKRLLDHYQTKLPELNLRYDPERLTEIVGIYYPDFRSIANHIEFEFA